MPVCAQRWLISACWAMASVALLGLAATPADAASSAGAASSARPGDRANVGATHSPELLSQLRGRSRNAPLTGTGEMGPAALASAAIAGDEQGVDVASFQHPGGAAINWSQVAASGVGFAAVKATEGDYYQNPYALTDLAGAQAAGLSVVAYAFAIPNGNGSSNSPVTQANYLLKYLGSYASTVPIMLDIEYNPYSGGQCYGLKGANMVAWVAAFDAQIQAKTGRMPIIYTPPAWWDSCTGNSTGFGPDPLWVPSITTGSPVLPTGWANWAIWQYSGTGTVSGIASPDTDLDQASATFLGLLNPGTQDQSDGAPAGLQLRQAIPAPGQTVSYTATGLPPGVSLTTSGDLTGWLTRAGTYSVNVSGSDSAGATQSQSFTWTVTAATGQGPTGPVHFGVGGKCLDDVGNSSASGTPVALGTCTGSAAQWTAAADRSLRSHGKCLSVSGSAKAERGQGSAGTVRGLRQPAVGRRHRRAPGQRRRRAVPERISQRDYRQPGVARRVRHRGQPGLDAARRGGAVPAARPVCGQLQPGQRRGGRDSRVQRAGRAAVDGPAGRDRPPGGPLPGGRRGGHGQRHRCGPGRLFRRHRPAVADQPGRGRPAAGQPAVRAVPGRSG